MKLTSNTKKLFSESLMLEDKGIFVVVFITWSDQPVNPIRGCWAVQPVSCCYRMTADSFTPYFHHTAPCMHFMEWLACAWSTAVCCRCIQWAEKKTVDKHIGLPLRLCLLIILAFHPCPQLVLSYSLFFPRSQRKKWIHCFDGVTAVVYVNMLARGSCVLQSICSYLSAISKLDNVVLF